MNKFYALHISSAAFLAAGLYHGVIPFYMDDVYLIAVILTIYAISVGHMAVKSFSFPHMVRHEAILPSLGLLGTFIGIGLTVADNGANSESLSGFFTAISTTIVGITCHNMLVFSEYLTNER